MSIHRRVAILERRRGICPECGGSPGASPTEYEVEWDDSPGQEPAEPEFCASCGRQIVYIVAWSDIEPDLPGGGGHR